MCHQALTKFNLSKHCNSLLFLHSMWFVLQDVSQRTLFECFKDLIPEEGEEEREEEQEDSKSQDAGMAERKCLSPTTGSESAGNDTFTSVSNWFEDLKDDDFCDVQLDYEIPLKNVERIKKLVSQQVCYFNQVNGPERN